ncbi:hypothetical protein CCHR01_03229 [Colletotrichum chrysophilum]|uniref:Uncharacterized protein n=1 Tax=Colletotrichum chrysophilum TaxID=1836956 RepID=A0AAD9EMM8_9PEZI|nr:hypothetical protein CCHR01_03229 [Colletotrichum chrysophilum]
MVTIHMAPAGPILPALPHSSSGPSRRMLPLSSSASSKVKVVIRVSRGHHVFNSPLPIGCLLYNVAMGEDKVGCAGTQIRRNNLHTRQARTRRWSRLEYSDLF